jgi:hypothetical protein
MPVPANPAVNQPIRISAPAVGRNDPSDRIADLDLLAHWMDTAFEIPALRWRFGLDAIIGLIPGVGDAATSLVSLYILHRASRLGVERATLTRMAMNVLIDAVVGAIPFAGDLFDVYWKANRKNVDLLRRHALATPDLAKRLKWTDRAVVALAAIAVVGILAAALTGAYVLTIKLWSLLT